jgi:tRNA-dihydrouridine synthase B
MAGCTDLAYRLVAREYGMEFCFLEMVAAESLTRDNESTLELMKTAEKDRPLGAQLMGCNPESMGRAAAMIEDMGYDLVDLNLGCPAPKVAGKGSGSALLANPEGCREIFTRVRKNVKHLPVTAKMRLGVSDSSGREAAVVAKIAEECGLDAVAVHGRTRVQGYTGFADYEAIARVKEAVKTIPVIGNGDVLSGEDAKRMLRVTGCDGVMIGRGGLGNPWIFKSVESVISGGEPLPEPSFEEKKKALQRHFTLEIEHRGERALFPMRRVACWYFKNLPGVAAFRGAINTCETLERMHELIDTFKPVASLSSEDVAVVGGAY